MSGIRITITYKNMEGPRRLINKLWDLLPGVAKRKIQNFLEKVMRIMRIYPPPRPKQKYKRTFRLRENWAVSRIGDTKFRLANSTPYTKYVVGNAYGLKQAWMHVGRWKVFRDVLDNQIKTLPKGIADELVMVARRG